MEQRPFKSPLPTQTAFTNLNGFGVEVTIKFHFTLKATWSLEWCDNRLPTGPGDRKSHLWQSCLKGWLQPTMKLHPLRFKWKSYKWNFMWWLHLLVLGTHLALQLSKHFSRQHLCQMHYGPNDPTLIMEGAPHTSHWTLPIWSANSKSSWVQSNSVSRPNSLPSEIPVIDGLERAPHFQLSSFIQFFVNMDKQGLILF